MVSLFDTINNDLVMSNEGYRVIIESVKKNDDFKRISKQNYIIQSVIHVNAPPFGGKN